MLSLFKDYHKHFISWPGLKSGQILAGKVRPPLEAAQLYRTLHEAETGIAQGQSLEYETTVSDDVLTELDLNENETLRLPPTPEQLEKFERHGYKDELDMEAERKEREEIMALPAPPRHPSIVNLLARRQLGLGLTEVNEDDESDSSDKEDKTEVFDADEAISKEEMLYRMREEELNRELEELDVDNDSEHSTDKIEDAKDATDTKNTTETIEHDADKIVETIIIPPALPPRTIMRPPVPPRAARSSVPDMSRLESSSPPPSYQIEDKKHKLSSSMESNSREEFFDVL